MHLVYANGSVMTSVIVCHNVRFTNLFSNQGVTMHFTYLVLEKVYSTLFGNLFHLPCIRLNSSASQSICIQFIFPHPVKHCRSTKDAQAQKPMQRFHSHFRGLQFKTSELLCICAGRQKRLPMKTIVIWPVIVSHFLNVGEGVWFS